MSTKWKTGYLANKLIQAVEIVRETEQSVFILGSDFRGERERREAKETSYHAYHDSWDEAKQHLMDKAEQEVFAARAALQRAQDKLGNVKGLKKPEAA